MTSFPIELFSQEFSHLLKTCFFSSITKEEIHLQIYIIKNMKGTQEFRLVLVMLLECKKKSVISRIFHQPRPVPDRMKMQVSVMSEPPFSLFPVLSQEPGVSQGSCFPGDPFPPELYFCCPRHFQMLQIYLSFPLPLKHAHISYPLGCILFWK